MCFWGNKVYLWGFPKILRFGKCIFLFVAGGFWDSVWEPVDSVVADPIAQDNDKRNNLQIYTEIHD